MTKIYLLGTKCKISNVSSRGGKPSTWQYLAAIKIPRLYLFCKIQRYVKAQIWNEMKKTALLMSRKMVCIKQWLLRILMPPMSPLLTASSI